jgi:hypothetical protein
MFANTEVKIEKIKTRTLATKTTKFDANENER